VPAPMHCCAFAACMHTEAVSEAVLNTGLHRIADTRVKYSVAALVERGASPFCCCLWIYIAATR
jgi:coiled-coil and C2 domain-containing protein 2A